MVWGDWGVGSGLIVDGLPEGVYMAVELVDQGYVWSIGNLYEAPRGC